MMRDILKTMLWGLAPLAVVGLFCGAIGLLMWLTSAQAVGLAIAVVALVMWVYIVGAFMRDLL